MGHQSCLVSRGMAGLPGTSSALKPCRGWSFIHLYSTSIWGECQVLFQVLKVQPRIRQTRIAAEELRLQQESQMTDMTQESAKRGSP